MRFIVYEETIDEGSGSVMERLASHAFATFAKSMEFLRANTRYAGVDLELKGKVYEDVQVERKWFPIASAPEDGTFVWLKGSRHKSMVWTAPRPIPLEIVVGWWGESGMTQGWYDEEGKWFVPHQWAPLEENKEQQ